MCGIVGLINKRKQPVSKSDIKSMTDKLIHRGPDAEGQYVWNNVGLGHRRLSIIELSDSGRQPMISEDENYIIVFNGEIYNFIEIRKALKKKGIEFSSKTDTEVILKAYQYWGQACVKRFNGMWAFSILDKQNNILFCSRDRMGVKPFCYLNNENVFCFASEPKAILEIFPEERIMDKTSVYRVFQRNLSDADERTFYKNIKQLLPAHNMIIDLGTMSIKQEQYWQVDADAAYEKWIKGKDPVKVFKKLMENAVEIRLRSDAKLGTSLSGGMDSSAIVGIMNKKFHQKVHTFSSIYDDEECNEKEYIDKVNKFNNTIPHLIYPDGEQNRMDIYEQMAYYHDGPVVSASLFSGYCVYKEAHKNVKVLIDGQGADEILAGYLPYNARLMDLMEAGGIKNKLKALKMIVIFHQEQPQKMEEISSEVMRWAFGKKGAGLYKYKKTKLYENHRELFQKSFLDGVDTGFNFKTGKVKGNLNQLLYEQLMYTCLPGILHNVDNNSMNFSVEVRCPFLDYRIVEFAMALDGDYKIRRQWTKWILRKALKEYLPDKVLYRTNKMGFPAPFGRWLQEGDEKEKIKELLASLDKRNIFNDGVIWEYYKQHISGKMDRSVILYQFMNFEMWLRRCID